MIARIRLGLRNISDWELLRKVLAVLQGMKDNPRFPSPWVSMKIYEASIEAFKEALNNQKNSGIHGTADKNAKRHAVITHYRNLACYVESIAKDDDHDLITAAGFETKKPTPGPIPMPKGVILNIENAGTGVLLLKSEVVPNVATYCIRWVLLEDDGRHGEWPNLEMFPNTRMRIEGLIPGKVYAFQVRAVGAAGTGDWSDPVHHRSL